MNIPNLDKHYDKAAELKKKHGDKASSFPFKEAAELAGKVVQKWLVESPSKFSKEPDARGVFNWPLVSGWRVASDHCVRYVTFHSGEGHTLIGLGYDLRHWILDGHVEHVPWRIWFFDDQVPDYVKLKLQGKQDVFEDGDKKSYFVLVPKKFMKGLEQLSYKDEDNYVKELDKAVSDFLDDLYGK